MLLYSSNVLLSTNYEHPRATLKISNTVTPDKHLAHGVGMEKTQLSYVCPNKTGFYICNIMAASPLLLRL